jgi:L-alanine-DL-glutamate epimerase-like enolase superfamily enzyme
LRIDANQGWSPEQAILVLNALGDANIQHCEEPIPRWQFMELRRVKEASPIPIMADESCCDHHDAERLIGLDACHRFNIKLGKSGGLFKAKKIIALAEAAGMEVQIGGFLESRLAWTAAAHLAMTSDTVRYCDMDTPLMFTEDPVLGGLNYGARGTITVPPALGLGASIGPAYLNGGSRCADHIRMLFCGCQRFRDIRFTQHLAQVDLDAACHGRDGHIVRASLEGVLGALADASPSS